MRPQFERLLILALSLLNLNLLVVKAQTSLLDTINAELASLSITLPLNDQTTNIPAQFPIDPTTVILKEVVCNGFALGGVVLSGAEDGTQVVDATTFERYLIDAGALDISVQCTIDITTQSCGNVRNNGKIAISATDFDISTQITLLSEDYATSGPVDSLLDSRPCSQIVNLVLSSPVYTDITIDTFSCFVPIPIDGVFAGLMNTLVVDPLLSGLSEQLCEPIRNLSAPLGELLLAAGGDSGTTFSSIAEVAIATEVSKLGGDSVFDAPTDVTVEAFDAAKAGEYADDIVEDATNIVDGVIADLDERAATDPDVAEFLAVARETLTQLQSFNFSLASISLQDIFDLALQPGTNITAILEAVTGDAALAAQLTDLIDAAIKALDLGAISIGDLFPPLQNLTGGTGGGGIGANATSELVDTLRGILTGDTTAAELIELISSLVPGNSTFGLEEFTEEIDTVLGLLNGGTSGAELIELILELIPGNETFGLDTPAAAELIDILLNGTVPDSVDLVPLIQQLLDTFLPDLIKIPVPGLGEVGLGVKLDGLNFSLPSTGQLGFAGQTSVVLPSLDFNQWALDLTITLFLNVSLSLPPLIDIGPIVFQDDIVTSLTVGQWAVAASALFGFDYTSLLQASKIGLDDPVDFAGCSASSVYAMLSGVFIDFSLFNVEVAANDALLSVFLEVVNIFFDLYGSSLPSMLEAAVYDATSGISDQDINSILPSGEASCTSLGISSGGGASGGDDDDDGGDALLAVLVAVPIVIAGALATAAVMFWRRRRPADGILSEEEVKPLEHNTPNPVHAGTVEESQGHATETEVILAKDAIDDEL